MRSRSNASTLNSFSEPGSCYDELLKYLVHIIRKGTRQICHLIRATGRRAGLQICASPQLEPPTTKRRRQKQRQGSIRHIMHHQHHLHHHYHLGNGSVQTDGGREVDNGSRVEMSTTLGISCYLSLSLIRTPFVDLWAPAVQNLCIVFIRPRATLSRCAAALHLLPHFSRHIRGTHYHLRLQYIRTTPRYSHLWP